MRDHTSAHMFGPGTDGGRRRSGATLSLAPFLAPVRDASDGVIDDAIDGVIDGAIDDVVGVDAGVSARPAHRPARRRASGPRPVRPGSPGARPAPGCRTAHLGDAVRASVQAGPEQQSDGRERVLLRAPQRAPEPLAWRFRVRRAVAGVVAVLVAAAVVVGLGLLADAVSAARQAAPAGIEHTVTGGSLTSVDEVSGQVPGVLVR